MKKGIATAFVLLLSFFTAMSHAQTITTVYLFPGQGSDGRLFDSLRIDPGFRTRVIEYGTPDKRITMKEFARQLSQEIDTTQPFVLVGVSLGGMICVELGEMLNPGKVVIISSARNRKDFPFRYRFQKAFPLYEVLPAFVLRWGALALQPIVEPDRNRNRETFRSMLRSKSPVYIKRTIRLVTQWERSSNSREVILIHGNNDHTLPIRKIGKVDYEVENGSHMMTLTRADELSRILNKILKD